MDNNQPAVYNNIVIHDLKFQPEILRTVLLGNSPSEEASAEFDKVLVNVCNNSKVSAGYIAIPDIPLKISNETLAIGEIIFHVKKIISLALQGSEQMYVFTASIGDYCEILVRERMKQGDFLHGYLADGIGSALTEAAAEYIEECIAENAATVGHTCSMRYSPGYCGWSVADQHKLFSFFPTGFCGITLTEHAMMLPLKSVSGIIGAGKQMKRNEYQCAHCTEEDCLHHDKK